MRDDTSGLHRPISAESDGQYGYAAGSAPATVTLPTGAKLERVSLIAQTSGAATVAIDGGNPITVVAAGGFDEQLPGDVSDMAEVVFAGAVASYYVAWTT